MLKKLIRKKVRKAVSRFFHESRITITTDGMLTVHDSSLLDIISIVYCNGSWISGPLPRGTSVRITFPTEQLFTVNKGD